MKGTERELSMVREAARAVVEGVIRMGFGPGECNLDGRVLTKDDIEKLRMKACLAGLKALRTKPTS